VVSPNADRERLQGLRVLLVEDEFLLAIAVEEDLKRAGCRVLGPIGSLDRALAVVRSELLQAAIVDMNLNGIAAHPLADELISRQIPFLLLTGYGRADLPERFRDVPRIAKPYDPPLLLEQLARIAPART
jgi:CheY-like chemotaxis protein